MLQCEGAFDQSPIVHLLELQYTEDENTNNWEKRKVDFVPVSVLPKTFQDLLTKTENESFMNIHLWKDILEHHCDRTHSQYGIEAIVRAAMIIVNKEIWKAYFEQRDFFLRKDAMKRKNQEMQVEVNLKKKQMSARE